MTAQRRFKGNQRKYREARDARLVDLQRSLRDMGIHIADAGAAGKVAVFRMRLAADEMRRAAALLAPTVRRLNRQMLGIDYSDPTPSERN